MPDGQLLIVAVILVGTCDIFVKFWLVPLGWFYCSSGGSGVGTLPRRLILVIAYE